jgi:hypothetical protein
VTANKPAYILSADEIGLNNRNYRDYPTAAATASSAPAGGRRLQGAAPGAAARSAPRAAVAGAVRDERTDPPFRASAAARRLHGTAMGAAHGGAAGRAAAGGARSAAPPLASGASFVATGDGAARPIAGSSIGFDGIGAPETNTIPLDLSIAVGATAAIHTANGLIRFYRVDAAGKKASDDSTFLKQVWMQDFFYSVGAQRGMGGRACGSWQPSGRLQLQLHGLCVCASVCVHLCVCAAPAGWRRPRAARRFPDPAHLHRARPR